MNKTIIDIITEEVSNFFDMAQEKNPDRIFSYIKTLPNTFKLTTTRGDMDKMYGDGLSTAYNNSAITRFYLSYLRKDRKYTKVLPVPEVNPVPYDKLNEIIRQCDYYNNLFPPSDEIQSSSILNMSDTEKKKMDVLLFKAMCFQLMNALLYEDYFGVNFRYGNVHEIINNEIEIPKDDEEFWKLYDKFNERDGVIRSVLFYADVIPVIRTIENFERSLYEEI